MLFSQTNQNIVRMLLGTEYNWCFIWTSFFSREADVYMVKSSIMSLGTRFYVIDCPRPQRSTSHPPNWRPQQAKAFLGPRLIWQWASFNFGQTLRQLGKEVTLFFSFTKAERKEFLAKAPIESKAQKVFWITKGLKKFCGSKYSMQANFWKTVCWYLEHRVPLQMVTLEYHCAHPGIFRHSWEDSKNVFRISLALIETRLGLFEVSVL